MFMDAHLGNKRKYKKIFLIRVRIAGGEGPVIGMGQMEWGGCFLGDKDDLDGKVLRLTWGRGCRMFTL